MCTRRSYFPPTSTIPHHSRKQTTNVVEPEFRTIVTMADNRTMAQMLQALIEGYEDAIVVPQINTNNFELKQTLINLVQSNQFTGRQDPHNHLHFFNKVTSTFIHPEVPNTTIKLLLFLFSLEGEARIWLDKEPSRSILTWEDLIRRKFLDKIPRECFSIIESKSKVRYSRSRITDMRANANAPLPSSSHSNSFDLQQIPASLEDKLDIRMNRFEKSLNDMKNSFITLTAPLKAVEEVCVTCGANHSYNQCPLTRGNDFPVFHDNIQQFQTAAVGNFIQNPNQNASNQMRPPRFNQPSHQNNNQNRFQGNNFNQNRQKNQGAVYQNRPQQALNYQAPSQQNTVTQGKFKAYTTANDANINNLQLKFDNFQKNQQDFQKKFEQKQDDFQNQMMIFMQNLYNNKPSCSSSLPNLHFELSFADALVHMPKFAPMFKKLLNNKDKLIELSKTPLNKNCSAVVLKKLPVKLGGIDFESEEIENFLNDDSIPFGVEDSPFNMDEDILFLESLLSENPIPPHLIIPNQTKLPIEKTNHSLNMGQSTEPVNDNASDFTIISNPLFDNDKINSDEINSHVESNSDESTSNHDTMKSNYLDEFYGPFIPIHILEEERIKREHADYISRIEMLFTNNPRPHNPTNDNTNVESFSLFPIPNQESEPRQEEIDVVFVTNDVLPPSDDDSDEEVDVVGDLRVDNVIQNSEHEYSESEDFDFVNLLLPLPPPEPPDKEFNFEKEISVVRNAIVKFECIDARVKFDVFNEEKDVLSYFMFVIFAKEFSLLSAKSEDTIFDPGISD
nr:reverse transcriptase domain-containing protein [Tanacetum cinerariifolium]